MSTAPGAPDEGLLRKIELKADLKPEDVEDQDVQTARQEVLGLAADPAVESRLARLRTSVTEYRKAKESELATPEAARAKVAIEDVERAIDEVQAQPRVAVEEPVMLGKMQEFGLRMKTAFEKLFKGDFDGFGETLAKGLPLFALRLLGKIPLVGETFKPYIAQAEGIDAARKALSPSELLTTDRDDDLLKQLQGQYDAKPEEFKKSMTFEKFLEARARSARHAGNIKGYTLLDLVNARMDSELSTESADRKKKEEEAGKQAVTSAEHEKKREYKKISELEESNPAVSRAIYTYALARAVLKLGATLSSGNVTPEAFKEDLRLAQENGTTPNSTALSSALKSWFESTNAPALLGVHLDAGVLEEEVNDRYHWLVYDSNIHSDFDPSTSPKDAVTKLLTIAFREGTNELQDGTNINATMRLKFPLFQQSLKAEVQKIMGDVTAVGGKEEKKESAPAPAQVAAAPAPTPTPAAGVAPTEAPATQTA